MPSLLLATGLVLVGLLAGSPQVQAAQDQVRSSVVKVHATHQSPDLFRPWMRLRPRQVSGSGVVIEGKCILTNAHVVQYAREIMVQGYQSAEKVAAKVRVLTYGMDLALLELEDESFFDDRPPLALADRLPKVKDTVNVYGYPIGGEQLSVTEGIVSRIQFERYYQSARGLRIQVDAALNPGNSGGPAVVAGRMVGLVFSKIRKGENIGYLVPAEEIERFLEDIKDGDYDGKPAMFDELQTVENEALRKRLGLGRNDGGIMVTRPASSDDSYPLQEWDTIIRIGDHPIDREGKVRLGEDLRLSFQYLIPKLTQNGKVPLTVRRQGKEVHVELPVSTEPRRVVRSLKGRYPRYFIYGPLSFMEVSQELAVRLLIDPRWVAFLTAHSSPILARQFDRPRFDGEELVVAGYGMFPHRLTKGYDSPTFAVVSRINGVPVRNLNHLVELLRDCKQEYVVFEFAGRGYEKLVFRHKDMEAATETILTDNGIRFRFSEDLRAVWTQKK